MKKNVKCYRNEKSVGVSCLMNFSKVSIHVNQNPNRFRVFVWLLISSVVYIITNGLRIYVSVFVLVLVFHFIIANSIDFIICNRTSSKFRYFPLLTTVGYLYLVFLVLVMQQTNYLASVGAGFTVCLFAFGIMLLVRGQHGE